MARHRVIVFGMVRAGNGAHEAGPDPIGAAQDAAKRCDGRGARRRRRDRSEDPEAAASRGLAPVGLLRLAADGDGAGRRGRGHARDDRDSDLRLLALGAARDQRPLSPGRVGTARAALDAPPRPHDDLRPDRRHLHAVRPPGDEGDARPGDPDLGLGARRRRRHLQPRLVERAEAGHRRRLSLHRLGRDRRLAAALGEDRPGRGRDDRARRRRSTRPARSSTRASGPTRTPRSSATTRSSTCS